ncbi:UNVERIFIED_CONTAM: MurR/RpiR family transcriptional regulator [Halobacillus marinus]|uniref:MurR/RpiR family transcriptional regulator n=1 Tax=Bacillus sp. SB49 TaxID=1071080 RepID=UPI000428D04A|nr:MurR/RpiR family transcriptional regulator [Bacillus sp. SB49]QHT47851.1 MurR/RpiR family transcriptional regulator [Bacillus sp. SB49]
MEESVLETIKGVYSSLSPGQKKVAAYMIDHREESALATASRLGRLAGVSETTVIRLSNVLGFRGFSHLQEAIREEFLMQKQSVREHSPAYDVFSDVAEKERHVFGQLLEQLDRGQLKQAVDALIAAEQVHIAGFGSSYAVGYWFYAALRMLRSRVSLSGPDGVAAEDIGDIRENSLLVLFSFPRYRKEGMLLAEEAKKQGAVVLVLTNKALAPPARSADITVTTEERMESDYHSIAGAVSISEMLIEAVMEEGGNEMRERQQRMEQLYAEQNLFLE